MESTRTIRHAANCADVAAAEDAAALTVAQAVADHRRARPAESVVDRGATVRAEVLDAAVALQRYGLPVAATRSMNWTGFGVVLPVLSGSPAAGASVVAAVIADVLQVSGKRVLMVDSADPRRSGLASAARSDGPRVPTPHTAVCIRYSWRGQALLARLETSLPVIAPGMVPPPALWLPPGPAPNATVVDLGHDPWRIAANPLVGAGGWLRRGQPSPRPLLVVRATRPALLQAEQLLARLEPWVSAGTATPVAQLIVVAAKRWPAGVRGVAGRLLSPLLDGAVFLPHDLEVEVGGVDDKITPPRLRKAVTPLLQRWGAIPARGRQGSTRHGGRS